VIGAAGQDIVLHIRDGDDGGSVGGENIQYIKKMLIFTGQ
jgi:hypothetical protein